MTRKVEFISKASDAASVDIGSYMVCLEANTTDEISVARQSTNKPLLVRGTVDPWQAAKFGADFVVTEDPEEAMFLSPVAWLEVHSVGDVEGAKKAGWPGIVIASNYNSEGELVPGNAEAISRGIPHAVSICASGGYDQKWYELNQDLDLDKISPFDLVIVE